MIHFDISVVFETVRFHTVFSRGCGGRKLMSIFPLLYCLNIQALMQSETFSFFFPHEIRNCILSLIEAPTVQAEASSEILGWG